jgi:hypothetical protein
MTALPDASCADPGRALPARLFWIPILVLDALLLALLPRAAGAALTSVALVALVWMVRRSPVSLAVAAAGMPLLYPVGEASGDDRTTFVALILFVLLPGMALAWGRLWGSRGGPSLRPVLQDSASWLAAALGAWLMCGLAWTPGPWYGAFKTQMYFGVNLLLYAGAAFYLGREQWEDGPLGRESGSVSIPAAAPQFLRALFWLQVAIALTALWNWFTRFYMFRDDRLRTLGMNPIWSARHAGLGIVVLLGLQAMGRLRFAVLVPALVLFGWVLLRTGSRGPLLAVAVILGYWALTAPRARRSLGLTRALWIGAGMAVFGAVMMAQRIAGLFAAGRRVSNFVRTRLIEVSVHALSGVTLQGLGTGGFPSLFHLPDDRQYPHNIFLEVLLENGLIGLLLFLGFLTAVFVRWRGWKRHLRARPESLAASEDTALHRTVGAVLLFALINAQFSGDIWVNEWVWVAAGIVVAWAPRDAR